MEQNNAVIVYTLTVIVTVSKQKHTPSIRCVAYTNIYSLIDNTIINTFRQ